MSVWYVCFSGGASGKEPASDRGDVGLIPGLGRFPGEGNGNQLQYSWRMGTEHFIGVVLHNILSANSLILQ